MNLHYKKEFVDSLRNGTKKHTIRKKAVKRGTELKHIIYPYQPNRRECVLKNTCVSCQYIKIVPCEYMTDSKVWVNGILLSFDEVRQLAWNDGFHCLVSFWLYFNEIFEGYIIHWTDLQY